MIKENCACEIPSTMDEFESAMGSYKINYEELQIDSLVSDTISYSTYNATNTITEERTCLFEFQTIQNKKSDFFNIAFTAGSFNNQFLMPLKGYFTAPKIGMITDHYPYGNLRDIFLNYKDVHLTPNHKTVIALCIAYAMMKLHERKFIHGNLQLSNIYMNHEKLPVICGFDKVNTYPDKSQDPRYLAPEVLNQKEIDNKIDVYAFAYVLYEMTEETIAFEEYTISQIRALLQSGAYPRFTKTPPSIAKLINSCWQQSPVQRPTFADIFSMIAEGKVLYPGTDPKEIQQYAISLNQNRKRDFKYDSRMGFGSEDLTQGKAKNQIVHKTIRINYNIAENSLDANTLVNYIQSLFEKIPKSDYQAIFEIINYHMKNSSPSVVQAFANLVYHQIFIDDDFRKILVKNDFLNNIPIISQSTLQISMDIIAFFITKAPSYLNESMNPLFDLFIHLAPSESLALFHHVINNKLPNLFIYKTFLSYAKIFMDDKYIRRYSVALCTAFQLDFFKDNFKEDFYSVYIDGLNHSSLKVKIWSYYCLIPNVPQDYKWDVTKIIPHIFDPNLSVYCIRLLLLIDIKIPPSPKLFSQLFILSRTKQQHSFLLLCKYMSLSVEHVRSSQMNIWLPVLQNQGDIDQGFTLLLIASTFISSETILPSIPGIFDFILILSQKIRNIVPKDNNKLPDETIAFIKLLASIQFKEQDTENPELIQLYSSCLQATIHAQDKDTIMAGIMLLQMAARIVYLSDYVNMIPKLKFLLKPEYGYINILIPALTEMVKYEGMADIMRNQGIVKILYDLSSYSQLKDQITKFLSYFE